MKLPLFLALVFFGQFAFAEGKNASENRIGRPKTARTPANSDAALPDADSAAPVADPQPNPAPRADQASPLKLKSTHVLGLGMAFPTKTFVFANSIAVSYDFIFPLAGTDFGLRAGLWGFMRSKEDAGTTTTYTVLNVDVGADYWVLNDQFKLAVGGRLGYAIPLVTIRLANGTALPFSGNSSITPALNVAAYYQFSEWMVGLDTRAVFYNETAIGVPAHIFTMLSVGKTF